MDSALTVAIVSASISAVVSVSVAIISPTFTHRLWKQQKHREQKLAVAQRFAALSAEFVATSLLDESGSVDDRVATIRRELMGILYLVPVLFEERDASMLAAEIRNSLRRTPKIAEKIIDLQNCLFAEALELPFERSTRSGE